LHFDPFGLCLVGIASGAVSDQRRTCSQRKFVAADRRGFMASRRICQFPSVAGSPGLVRIAAFRVAHGLNQILTRFPFFPIFPEAN
jgi:hypothetical protein